MCAFLPVLNADFINFDDPQYVTGNPTVREGLSAAGLRWALTSFDAANWHPLTWMSHMLDVSLFGVRPGPHHLVNLALHATSAVLLMVLLNGLTGVLWPGVLAATLFAIHPLRVESVAWIAERKDVLSVLFGMLTLLSYLRYLKQPSTSRYLTIVAAFALGLMAKPMLVTLPLLLLLLDWWPLGRFHPPPSAAAKHPWQSPLQLFVEKAPLLALSAASSVITYLAQQTGGATPSGEFCPLDLRAANALVSCVSYVGMTLWPRNLIPFYVHPGLSQQNQPTALALILLVGITAVALSSRRRHPWLIVGWFWYIVALVPVIGLVQLGEQARADRYSYLPAIGLTMAIAWEVWFAAAGQAWRHSLAVAGTAVVIAALTVLTWKQSTYWKNSATLFGRVVTVDPRNYLALDKLGADLLMRHQAAPAVPLLRKGLEIAPWDLEARYNLGLALAATGDPDAAIEQFLMVVRLKPDSSEGLFELGRLLLEKGRVTEALQRLESARTLSPERPEYLVARGLALARLDRKTEAAEDFLHAGEVLDRAGNPDPRTAETYTMLGANLLVLDEPERAAALLREALKISPGNLDARYNLGLALAAVGDADAAIEEYLAVVRVNPGDAEVLYNLGKSLQNKGRDSEALLRFEAALSRRPGQPEILLARGIALARLGREAEAVEDFLRVIELDSGNAEARINLENALRTLGRRESSRHRSNRR